MKLKFKCPVCGGTQLEEVQPSATVTSRISSLDSEGDHDHEDNPAVQANDDSPGIFFQCFECGAVVVDGDEAVNDCVALAEWLKRQTYNGKE